MFLADLRHTGVHEARGPIRPPRVRWKFKTGRVVEAWFSSPTVTDGTAYFGAGDGYLYAADAETGQERWRCKTGDLIYSSPAVAGGIVYVGSHDGSLYAVDAATGRERWRFRTGYRVYSSPAVADGMVYFGCDDGYLYALR
jgi:outer membrane protein assembly factor BamB